MEDSGSGVWTGNVDSPVSRLYEEREVDERAGLLEQAPLFSVLHPSDLRAMAGKFHRIRYRPGELIFPESDQAERPYLIDEGRVKLSSPKRSSAGGR